MKTKHVTRNEALESLSDHSVEEIINLTNTCDYEGLKAYIAPFISNYYDRLFPHDFILERIVEEVTGNKICIIGKSFKIG